MRYQRHKVEYEWRSGSRWGICFPTLDDANEFWVLRIEMHPELEATRPYPCDNMGRAIQTDSKHC